jgi:heme-degrading monooxygenase HmoA
MAEVVTIASGSIDPARVDDVESRYRRELESAPPTGIEQTYLLRGDGGRVAVVTFWRSRADLDAMRASGEEPFARRLIREAGGTPEVAIYDVAAGG